MESEKLKRRKVLLSNNIMPWFMAISDDLMFFIAIHTLFFTVVKGLSVSEIAFLNTISSLAYVLLQVPFLKIIQKVGNIKSIRIGTSMLLCSSILITFGNHYIVIMLGYVIYIAASLFKTMDNVILKNNLTYLNKQDDYIKISNKSKIIYSILTAIIAFVAGGIFSFHHYLPMYLCIGICMISVLLTFCIYDSNDNKQSVKKEIEKKEKVKFSKIMVIILFSYALLYATISMGQENSQLFIQNNLAETFDIGLTATYLGIIIATSRVARIFGNLVFHKAFPKFGEKTILALPIIGMIAFICILVGGIYNAVVPVKFIWMTIGFDVILAVRDPIQIYARDLALKNVKKREQQKAISYLELSRKIGETVISLLFSILLTKFDLLYVIVCLIVLTIISFGLNNKLYQMVKEK